MLVIQKHEGYKQNIFKHNSTPKHIGAKLSKAEDNETKLESVAEVTHLRQKVLIRLSAGFSSETDARKHREDTEVRGKMQSGILHPTKLPFRIKQEINR